MATETKGIDGETGGAAARPRDAAPSRAKRRRPGPDQGEVGRALRSVYDDMVKEGVPDDLLDLLGKLD